MAGVGGGKGGGGGGVEGKRYVGVDVLTVCGIERRRLCTEALRDLVAV